MNNTSYRTYSKNDLLSMNVDSRYGSHWIRNLANINHSQELRLYPTGDANVSSGRKYIALPANKVLTADEKRAHNIIGDA